MVALSVFEKVFRHQIDEIMAVCKNGICLSWSSRKDSGVYGYYDPCV